MILLIVPSLSDDSTQSQFGYPHIVFLSTKHDDKFSIAFSDFQVFKYFKEMSVEGIANLWMSGLDIKKFEFKA